MRLRNKADLSHLWRIRSVADHRDGERRQHCQIRAGQREPGLCTQPYRSRLAAGRGHEDHLRTAVRAACWLKKATSYGAPTRRGSDAMSALPCESDIKCDIWKCPLW